MAEGPTPDCPHNLPECRRRIIIEDFDFGSVRHEINLFKTLRIDYYRMEVDGAIIKEHIGWTKVLEIIRKSFLRVHTG